MGAEWKKKPGCDLARVITELEKHRTVDASGRVSYSVSGLYEDCVDLLANALKCHGDIVAGRKRGIAFAAMCEAGAKGPLSEATIIQAVRSQERTYLLQKPRKFVLATELTMRYHSPIRTVRVSGSTITFRSVCDPRFKIPDAVMRNIQHQTRAAEKPQYSTWVRVSTEGRTEYDAGERALDALTLLRAFWNLNISYGRTSKTAGYRPAVNRILAGPAQTLHYPNGTIATDMFWYEPRFSPWRTTEQLTKKWPGIEDNRRYWQAQLRRCKYRKQIENALRRYAIALDDPDYESAFLKLWGVLEAVTATGYMNYDNTIRRASFPFKNRAHHKNVLESLRKRRNQQVHKNTFDGDPEQSLYVLKRYVDQLVLFHLNTTFGFQSLDEAAALLDLPTEKALLQRRQQIIGEALEWIRPKSK